MRPMKRSDLLKKFKKEIWSYYRKHRRSMPWRDNTSPYYVIVSEIMLQQTQVHRVTAKFDLFIKRFPNWKSLAKASTHEVLQEWSGLGYNRRALYLKRIAEIVTTDREYFFLNPPPQPAHLLGLKRADRVSRPALRRPSALKLKDVRAVGEVITKLTALPGIGPNTAGSILAFAFNIPQPFIETNIRSVFIHFFFPEIEKKEGKRACKKISDEEIFPFIESTVDRKNPREWFYALMDYGSCVKKQIGNPSRRSLHHVRQKPFKGSNRELRSKILRMAMIKPVTSSAMLEAASDDYSEEQISRNIADLEKEGFLVRHKNAYQIAR